MTQVDYFPSIIGQKANKSALSFYIDAFKTTKRLPFLLFTGAKGTGKTNFARKLKDPLGYKCVEINCSVVKTNKVLFEIWGSIIRNNKDLIFIWDESHNLSDEVTQTLLTICDIRDNHVRTAKWEGQDCEFDFTKIAFVFCSSEPQKIFQPLLDRLTVLDVAPYSEQELGQILRQHCGHDITIQPDVLPDIVQTLRGNARACVKRSEEIRMAMASCTVKDFGRYAWDTLRQKLGIQELGVSNSELSILRLLGKRGSCSLQEISASTGLSRSCIQKNDENFLLRNGFIKIEGVRKITALGRDFLAKIDGPQNNSIPAQI